MKIAVISDIHENFHNLFLALEEMKKQGVRQILCLGDLMNPGVAKILAAQDLPTYMIWGNNDGEKVDITKASLTEESNLTVGLNTYDFLNFDGKNIFMTHYFDLADPMAKSGDFDAVFYGHDHMKTQRTVNGCLVLNPGELAASKTGIASFGIYDTSTGKAEIIQLDGAITLKSAYSDDKLNKYLDKFSRRGQKAYE